MAQPDNRRDDANRGSAMIAAAIVGAALIVSWGISSGEPRYQIAGAGDTLVRLDTDSGELLACNQQRCVRVEAPDRTKTLGPLKVVLDDAQKQNALPAPAPAKKP